MKTSIRLAVTSLAVSCITLAASGAPLPFFHRAKATPPQQAVLLAPESLDGQGGALLPSRSSDPADHTLKSSARQ